MTERTPDPDRTKRARLSELSTVRRFDLTRPPEEIGPYRILETLGEGGMGVVYLARQEKPVERLVALKVIKLGMDTKEVVARFETERQALALMDHPHIARVFEAGVTDQGRPFFAMEHVPGTILTDYCDRHRLDTKERLRLFIQVCRGIHHAHQKGIIHRDIKPSNILVMVQDGKPIPKVIDFGVAKATNRRLTEKTVFTEQGQLIGTPAYMSPEQAEMTGLNVDTATDVYSLGVLLYELLTGTLPFDPRKLRKMGLESIHRVIREVEPPRPSTRVSTLGPRATKVAHRRRTEPMILQRSLRGELDWVVLRAMEKDRTRRYASAAELAADVERYLTHHPVVARPPSARYQLQKMAYRHKTAVGFVAALLVLVMGFGVWMGVLYTRAARAERVAATEAATATRITDYLVGLFEVSDPSEALGRTVTAKEILDRGADEIDTGLGNQPLVQARLLDTMGRVYWNLGLLDRAKSLLERSLRIKETELGPDHPGVAETLHLLGQTYGGHVHYDSKKALELNERALDIRTRTLGPNDIDTGWSLYAVGSGYSFLGNRKEAKRHIEAAQRIFEHELGPTHPAVAWCLNDLGVAAFNEGHPSLAVDYLRRALDIKTRALDPKDPDVFRGMNALGYALTQVGRYEEALPLLTRAIQGQEEVLGERNAETALSIHSLGELHLRMGNSAEARDLFLRALSIQEEVFGSESLDMAQTLHGLGSTMQQLHRYADAESYLQRAIAMYRKTGSETHPYLPSCLEEYAEVVRLLGRDDEAARFEARADSIRKTVEEGG